MKRLIMILLTAMVLGTPGMAQRQKEPSIDEQIEIAKEELKAKKEDAASWREARDKYEFLYLKLVNDFLKEEYTTEGYYDAKELLSRVKYNPMKEDLLPLINNYELWLLEMVQICKEAQQDWKTNPRTWTNPQSSHADKFLKKLDNCGYCKRAHQDWKIPYFDDVLIKKIKERMREGKSSQGISLHFKDCFPQELPSERSRAY